MARYVDAIDLPAPPEETFDYLADFSRTVEWDPGVLEAQRLDEGPVREGSRFRVIVAFLGQRLPIEYAVTCYERPHRIVLEATTESFRSIDEIQFAPLSDGTRIRYDARIELEGYRRIADPVMNLLFQVIGRMAVRGLRERFARPNPLRGASVRPGATTQKGAVR